jgi:hypothetical protein
VRFGPWYPLAEAGDLAPAEAGVLQLRLARGLLDYPTGKSAMVAYRHARDVRAVARALAGAYGGDLLCRHLIEFPEATDLAAFCAKLREDFVRRFGRPPIYDPIEAAGPGDPPPP